MKRLVVIPSDPIEDYIKGGYSKEWLKAYYNPNRFFDEVYLLSPLEKDNPDLLGMKVLYTKETKLRDRIKELNIDIVRAYGGNWACRMGCENKVKGVPVVVSVHDSCASKLYDSIKKADVVFCVSDAVKNVIKTKFKKLEMIWDLPNRVDFEKMKPAAEDLLKPLESQFPYQYKILFVGRLKEEKNLDTLIKALKRLGGQYCAIVIGIGDMDKYKAMAKNEQVTERCFFVGSVHHHELGKYYSLCDCMCTPSRREGFGMVFAEALACNAAVITSDIAPMNEFIKDNINGVLIKDYENPEAVCEAIQKVCTDQDLKNRLKQNARKSVEKFDRKNIDRLEAGYYEKIFNMKKDKAFEKPFWKELLKI